MTRTRTIAAAISLCAIAGAMPAIAGQRVYVYSILHPFYGDIGTLTETIDRSPEATRSDWRLRVAVRLLGVVVYRQESDTIEVMRGDRLVSLQSVTNKDGQHFEVHGEAQGDQFFDSTMAGSFAGPATIAPSDPWMLRRTGAETVVYMDTGRIIDVVISGGEYATVSANGIFVSARHFIVIGDKRQDIWLDNQTIPIMFRTFENGTPIDFVLQSAAAAGATTTTSVERPTLAGPARSDK